MTDKKKKKRPAEDAGDKPKGNKINNKSLAVRYRPTKLKDLVGQESIATKVKSWLSSKDIPGAILLVGPTGCGKTTVSQMIAKYVNCETMSACGECFNCKMDLNNHPDYDQINAATDGGKDDIRSLIKRSVFRPRHGNLRILHIDEAHTLTTAATEALLLPLENPPAQTLYILSTTDPDKLKQTVRDRCETLNIQLVPKDQMLARLNTIAKKEEVKVDPKVLDHIVDLSQGYMRNSIKCLETVRNLMRGNTKITTEEIKKVLDTESQSSGDEGTEELVMKVLTACYGLQLKAVYTFMPDLRTDWVGFLRKSIWLTQYMIDSALIKQRHPNVWHTPLNQRFAKIVKKTLPDLPFDHSNTLRLLTGLLHVLTTTQVTVISGGVSSIERSVITSALANWVISEKARAAATGDTKKKKKN